LAAPKPEVKPTEAASPATPPSTYAALQANPTVRMAPIPKEEASPRPAPPRVLPRAVLKPSLVPETRLADASVPVPAPKASAQHGTASYYVQAGAYASEERADRLAQSLDSLGARVSPATVDGRAVYRVRIGPFLDKDQANAAVSQAQSMGQADLRIVSE
jgi:cell division protein FtsN